MIADEPIYSITSKITTTFFWKDGVFEHAIVWTSEGTFCGV